MLQDLTAYSARCRGTRPFRASVIRFDEHGFVWLMNKPETGWASYGLRYNSLREVARDWWLRFVEVGRDEHSAFVRVEPLASWATMRRLADQTTAEGLKAVRR